MRKVAFYLQKGGVGKTTLAGNVAYAASAAKRTVLIDADPQGNSTSWLLREPPEHELADVLAGHSTAQSALVEISENLSILPTFTIGGDLQNFADWKIGSQPFIFDDLCETLAASGFELAIFDLSPGLRLLEKYVILAMDEVVTPLTPEFFSIDGIEIFTTALANINKDFRRNVQHRVIVANQMNRSFRRHRMIHDKFSSLEHVMFTVPQDAKIAEAQLAHETIFTYDPESRAIPALRKLATAIIEG